MEPKKEAEEGYCRMIYNDSDNMDGRRGNNQVFFKQCTPGYYNGEGSMTLGKTLAASFGGGQPGSSDGCTLGMLSGGGYAQRSPCCHFLCRETPCQVNTPLPPRMQLPGAEVRVLDAADTYRHIPIL